MLDAPWIDIRHSLRGFRRSPGFSLVVIATFALAIGANTAILGLLNAIVLRPVPVSDPDRLVSISTTSMQTTQPGFIYAGTFTAFRAQQRSFAALSMYSGGWVPRIEARGVAVYAGVEGVSPEYFPSVGARLTAGRFLTEADNAPAGVGTPAVVISYRLWQRVFGGDSRAVGETVKIDDTPASNTHGRDRTRGRSQTADCSVDRFSGAAARPRRRSSGALRLDTARKPWHKRDDWLGPSKHRGGHRGSGDLTSRPSSRPTARPSAYQHPSRISRGRSAAAAPRHWCDRDRRRAPARLFDDR